MTVTESEIEDVMATYPPKVLKNRKKHLVLKTDDCAASCPQIEANTRTVPGIISQRGCCYAGCKGVVVGPIKDMVSITHGPIGCGYYSWGTRRNKARADDKTPPEQIYTAMCFSTDMQESDIVFGGEKKLARMIDEVVEAFHPRAINICSTCPIGLIGDDLNAVAKAAEEKYGITVIPYNCEGYKGVSQSSGHHIANNQIMDKIIGTGTDELKGKYILNILGEYNIGGDGWEIERILGDIGYTVNSILTGDSAYVNIKNLHKAHLNLVQCHRSINYIAEMMETKYGIPWMKCNFIGVEATIDSLRKLAESFGDEELMARTEVVIEREIARITPALDQYRKICKGKTAFAFVGGSRSHHYQYLLRDLGMEVVVAGYEFAHRDDYEGRQVIPTIKSDADSKNIPELHIEPDPEMYEEPYLHLNLSKEKYDQMVKEGHFGYYEGMYPVMKDGTVMVDDCNHYETEELLEMFHPDLIFSGVRDKYISHKMGVPSKQLHSYDYSGPYAGFNGALIFAKDVAHALTTPAWKMITPPWEKETEKKEGDNNA
ncbi:nitrogenase molybdenum-iron protein alpha chain [Methanomicrobium sp. W14]|uniref:nitrogenase molybdenum-iron protein alpha chain n=1 Tax=Methanomicrobium sp. W14 TaxID=2817839 RepID=UPI001AE189F7|nr:nitrogenase molybdenum-iron protein alpha chain [Methanomicrobium sp. W14]MBP2132593.1 nitrogenase molybdenum-iron protein alpha chain [Methanomicrobium sp. W14]